jgi:hypothetical protein
VISPSSYSLRTKLYQSINYNIGWTSYTTGEPWIPGPIISKIIQHFNIACGLQTQGWMKFFDKNINSTSAQQLKYPSIVGESLEQKAKPNHQSEWQFPRKQWMKFVLNGNHPQLPSLITFDPHVRFRRVTPFWNVHGTLYSIGY